MCDYLIINQLNILGKRPGPEAINNQIQSLFRSYNDLLRDGLSERPIQLFIHVDTEDKGTNTDIVSSDEVPTRPFPSPEPKKEKRKGSYCKCSRAFVLRELSDWIPKEI